MQIVTGLSEVQDLCQMWKVKGESISFVPTMGCLHDGHLSLVKKAKSLADHVVVSIFVNPLQFGDSSDFLKYPNTFDEDIRKLGDIGVDIAFTPEANSFYPEGENVVQQIELGEISSILEGAHRPGHFSGVATAVKRLFDLIQPNSAIFGKKDFQQLIVIKQLVENFSLDVEIVGVPIFREQNGLAMSSRNLRLTKIERSKASEMFQQLSWIKSELIKGETDFACLEALACNNLASAGFSPDYVAICEIDTLLPARKTGDLKIILTAAKLGEIRLIDNLEV